MGGCCCSAAKQPEETFDSIKDTGDEFAAMRLQLSNIGKQDESTTATAKSYAADPAQLSPRSPERPKVLTPRLFKDRLGPVERELARRSSSKASEIAAAMRRPSELKDEPTEDPANAEAPEGAPAEAPVTKAVAERPVTKTAAEPAGFREKVTQDAAAASPPAETETSAADSALYFMPPAAAFAIDQVSDRPP